MHGLHLGIPAAEDGGRSDGWRGGAMDGEEERWMARRGGGRGGAMESWERDQGERAGTVQCMDCNWEYLPPRTAAGAMEGRGGGSWEERGGTVRCMGCNWEYLPPRTAAGAMEGGRSDGWRGGAMDGREERWRAGRRDQRGEGRNCAVHGLHLGIPAAEDGGRSEESREGKEMCGAGRARKQTCRFCRSPRCRAGSRRLFACRRSCPSG